MSTNDQPESKEWTLEPETEYRFELDIGTSLAIKLLSGSAEVFGSEIAVGRTYVFGSECKAAVFTWQGCKLEISRPSTEYVSDETPMTSYANLHLAFEQMRVKAHRAARGATPEPDEADNGLPSEAPRVLVLGPENSGKTSACKILANYAVRGVREWSPILINLDPSEGGWTVPGTVSVCPISVPIPTSSPANPLGSTATSAPTALSSSALLPLVYWFGHAEIRRNPLLMGRLIQNLERNINERLDVDPLARSSGLFIDTPMNFSTAGPSGDKNSLINASVAAFNVNVILIIGHEKLHVEVQRLFSNSNILIVKIPKSGGVVDLDQAYRDRVHTYQLRSYLYGTKFELPPPLASAPIASLALGGEASTELSLSPYSSVISFDDIKIYRIGEESMAPSSALPIGASRVISEMQPIRIDPAQGSGLLHAVLALLSLPSYEPTSETLAEDGILDLDVAGFLIVMALDIPNKKMTVLSPSPGTLVGRTALIGSFEWQE